MYNSQFMEIFNTRYNLLEVFACFLLLEPSVLNNVVKELTSTCILHDQIQLFGRFDYLIELYNVRVPDHFENLDLSGDSLHICFLSYFRLL